MNNTIPEKWYAIIHKPTGAYMPEMRRGYSRWKPEITQDNPRLFKTVRGAQAAIAAWSRGVHYIEYYKNDYTLDSSCEIVVAPNTQRDKNELMVVEVKLELMGDTK